MLSTPNELTADLLSVNSMVPFSGTISASRGQMFASHISQKLVVNGLQQRYLFTGMEKEFGKYTFAIKMPSDGKILKIIERYQKTYGQGSIELNPQTIIIYEDVDTKVVGMVEIVNYCSYHQYFGFSYETKPGFNQIAKGKVIDKDTIFLDSPAVGPQGEYKFGVQMNMCYMTHPSVSEDGIMISRDVLDKFKFKTYERRIVEWGSKRFPLNLYGTHSNFKAFPDIGEKIRDDGVLMMFRTYDPLLAPVEQSIYDLTEPDHMFDDAMYAAGPNGRIVDIIIHHDPSSNNTTPDGMDTQANKYVNASRTFYTEIVAEWKRLKKLLGDSLQITEEFHRLVVEALAAIDDGGSSKIQKLHRMSPLDDYRVEFVIEYEITPTIGFKLTDCMGGKAVICHIAEPHEMPVDEDGNRADIVMDPNSTVSRMNIGRLYEQYVNAASRDVIKRLRALTGISKEEKHPCVRVIEIADRNKKLFNDAFNYLLGYYKIISPAQFHLYNSIATEEQKVTHLGNILKDFIYLYVPTDNQPEIPDMIKALEEHYKPTYGPVSYIGYSGKRCVTKNPIRIGSVYMMSLEKIGDDWSAVSSGRLHHFGFLSPVNKTDKYSQPIRMQPVRAIGEAESRIFVSYCGQLATAELMDRNGSPLTHKTIVSNILKAPIPTNINQVVDRKEVPLGGSKPIQLATHVMYNAGIKFVYKGN